MSRIPLCQWISGNLVASRSAKASSQLISWDFRLPELHGMIPYLRASGNTQEIAQDDLKLPTLGASCACP